eukprot:jgi/Phyca11/113302/e_gw1.24.271.1
MVFASQDNDFNRCSNPFFSQLPTAEETDEWLEFPSLLPLTRRRSLYIRPSFKSIAAQALLKVDSNRRKYAVVTGTPGIGKSVFLYYVMWKLIKDKKRMLFVTGRPPIYFDGESVLDCYQLPYAGNRNFWSPDLWCLVDATNPCKIAGLPIHHCSVLLASEPRDDYVRHFRKLVPTPQVFYMPIWTEEEMEKIIPLYPSAASVWRDRFETLGGIPRLVLQAVQTDPQEFMRVCFYSLENCMRLVLFHSKTKTGFIDSLYTLEMPRHVHILSQEPYHEYTLAYASETAMRAVIDAKWIVNRAEMLHFLVMNLKSTDSLTQTTCHCIFELYAMQLLELGGTFSYRSLQAGVEQSSETLDEDENDIDIPMSWREIVDRVEADQNEDQLYVPKSAKDVAIDAWMPEVGGFQIALGKEQKIKSQAADELALLGQGGNRLFFLVFPRDFDSFTKQEPLSIEQYALLIPYPEV